MLVELLKTVKQTSRCLLRFKILGQNLLKIYKTVSVNSLTLYRGTLIQSLDCGYKDLRKMT